MGYDARNQTDFQRMMPGGAPPVLSDIAKHYIYNLTDGDMHIQNWSVISEEWEETTCLVPAQIIFYDKRNHLDIPGTILNPNDIILINMRDDHTHAINITPRDKQDRLNYVLQIFTYGGINCLTTATGYDDTTGRDNDADFIVFIRGRIGG
jgi:hypothetical protein